jgi:large subunit ribosomal protein L15
MKLHELYPAPGSRHRKKRVGRGIGSGHGTYATRGIKGQKARSGGQIPPWFEGGQTRLVKRLPHKRGFTNIFRVEYAAVNVEQLEARFPAGTVVTPDLLRETGLVKKRLPIKILGDGELTKPLTVHAHKFSASARAKIEAAGGQVVEIGLTG